ncbi:uncharacterized protein LOC125808902 [Solanum verrucosum]|uniref:uncharacterized protein LOC125808902 n=1 Tax=Solanum verrucosum TaxID=315347 RepID=UPI0020D16123|nr:uncharacterized protein LOC125808902 [Solanum verrucosum]
MLKLTKRNLAWQQLRRLSTAIRQTVEDEGDWFYSSEWWGTTSGGGDTVFRSISDKGNGVVSVVAYPSSKPENCYWGKTENWLQKRYEKMYPEHEQEGDFRILGYQWRNLHFNEETRQSTVKIMAAYRDSHPGSIYLMQQAECLAVPYVKSMVSAGLATIASCKFDLESAVCGRKTMKILCIGHGGGSIPLFLASKIQGAEVYIAEIDPVVISASVQAMGFPSYSVMTPSGSRAHSTTDPIQEVQWKGVHERIQLHESDAEKFLLENKNLYDLVFIDAYDGEDIFPHTLWDPHSPFLNALADQLHPEHGTVVVNLHSDVDFGDDDFIPPGSHLLPMGKYISKVCRSYKEALLGSKSSYNGLAYVVSVPWVCNTSLVVSRGLEKSDRDMVMRNIISKSLVVENILDLPFSCMQYLKRGFTLVS